MTLAINRHESVALRVIQEPAWTQQRHAEHAMHAVHAMELSQENRRQLQQINVHQATA